MFITLFAAVSLALGAVIVQNPLNAQFPSITRPNHAFSWTMSPKTFSTTLDRPLLYSVSGLPKWMEFNNQTLTFYGTPGTTDASAELITVTASDTQSTNSSDFVLYLSDLPIPVIQKNITQQFNSGNPALSSVYPLAPGSVLSTNNPTLRVPSGWSFSIGLQGDTFFSPSSLSYGALLSDRTPLPPWITFNPSLLTFNGVSPSSSQIPTPTTLEIALFASYLARYSAITVLFDLVVADHELSTRTCLPTINVTAGNEFNVTIDSHADYSGILVDGRPIQPANVSDLLVDTSSFSWLKYDEGSKTISGLPPNDWDDAVNRKVHLPVRLTSNFNQTLLTNMSVAIVQPYFTKSDLGTIDADPDQQVLFNLTRYFTNSAASPPDANLSASFSPVKANNFLTFDPVSAQLTGQIPHDSNLPYIRVSFVAYSHITHSTSHASLSVISPKLQHGHSNDLSGSSHSRRATILALSVSFGVIGGLLVLGIVLLFYRRCSRARGNDAGTLAWIEHEKQLYGVGNEVENKSGENIAEEESDWSREANAGSTQDKQTPTRTTEDLSVPNSATYEQIDPNLSLVPQDSPLAGRGTYSTTRMGELFGRIREMAGNVTNSGSRKPKRPVISKPVPHFGVDALSADGHYIEALKFTPAIGSSGSLFSYEWLTERERDASTAAILSDSSNVRSDPSTSADFVPPRSPKAQGSASQSPAQPDSLATGAAREYEGDGNTLIESQRGSLAETTQSQMSMGAVSPGTMSKESENGQCRKQRQMLDARRSGVAAIPAARRRVRFLDDGPSKGRLTSRRSSSSFDFSELAHGNESPEAEAPAFVVRVAERFKFRVPLLLLHTGPLKLEAKLISGEALPAFMQVRLKNVGRASDEKTLEVYGVPSWSDLGRFDVGVFNVEDGECLLGVTVNVVERDDSRPPIIH